MKLDLTYLRRYRLRSIGLLTGLHLFCSLTFPLIARGFKLLIFLNICTQICTEYVEMVISRLIRTIWYTLYTCLWLMPVAL